MVSLKPNLFQLKFMFSFKANLEMKRHQSSFELISFAKWKPIPVNDPEPLCYSSFVFATLVNGVIGYKFCWLLPQSRSTNWTRISWDTNWARIKWRRCRGWCHFTMISPFQSTCDLHHKFGEFSFPFSNSFYFFLISFVHVLV